MTHPLAGIPLVDAAVGPQATFAEAANLLVSAAVEMIAVVDDDRGVIGLFGSEEVVRGLFPRYLVDLHHTAFVADDAALLGKRATDVRDERVERHLVAPVTVNHDASLTHVGELFLHCRLPAIAVVENGRFVGMLGRREFARAVLERRWAVR